MSETASQAAGDGKRDDFVVNFTAGQVTKMANIKVSKRKSHCDICGKRLSFKTPYGDIRWRPSHIDDEGIYCVTCYLTKKYDEKSDKA